MPVLLSFLLISWLTEVHLVFSTRRAHQMFQMFISCLCTQWHFTSVLVFAYSFSWGFISIAPLFSGMEICSWEIWDQPYFFSFENDLVFLHNSPKNSLSLKFSSLALQYVSCYFPGTFCVLAILQSNFYLKEKYGEIVTVFKLSKTDFFFSWQMSFRSCLFSFSFPHLFLIRYLQFWWSLAGFIFERDEFFLHQIFTVFPGDSTWRCGQAYILS